VADAVIVGSAIIQRMEDLAPEPERIPEVVADFLRDLRAAIDVAAGL
jgi:tryptophan synthase alpha chain